MCVSRLFFVVRPAAHVSNGLKSRIRPVVGGRINSGRITFQKWKTRSYIGAKTKKMESRVKNYEKRIEREIKEKEGLLQDVENPVDLKQAILESAQVTGQGTAEGLHSKGTLT